VADAISPQALSDLIGSIYDCALDPSRWERTLADVSEALDCFALLLALNDLRHERLLIHKRVGIEPDQFERLAIYLPEVSAMLRGALASSPSLDEPHVMSRDLSPPSIEKSPYFQEWQNPAGMVDFMMLFLIREPMYLSTFGVGRNEHQGLITEREIELGRLLLPHLRRAVTVSKVLDVRTIVGGRMSEALDALRCGVVLTNEHGTILHANQAAEHMLDEGGPIQSRQGILQATAPSATSELRSALALAAGNEASIGKTGLGDPPHRARRATHLRARPAAHRERFPHAAAACRRCRRIHRRTTRRSGWCRRRGCRLWFDFGRNQGARQSVRRAHAQRDRRNARHHQADGENPP
jgi:PAS domain-containing protein